MMGTAFRWQLGILTSCMCGTTLPAHAVGVNHNIGMLFTDSRNIPEPIHADSTVQTEAKADNEKQKMIAYRPMTLMGVNS